MKSLVRGDAVQAGIWSNAQRSAGQAVAQLGLLALALSACALPEVLALEHEVYEVSGGVETLVSSGCTELPEDPGPSFGFGFGAAPGGAPVAYSVSYDFQSDLVRVSAGGFGAAATEAEYDQAFLRAGGEDELVVELAEDFSLRLLHRGVDGCDVSGAVSPTGPNLGPVTAR
jgi:hypothetical protein